MKKTILTLVAILLSLTLFSQSDRMYAISKERNLYQGSSIAKKICKMEAGDTVLVFLLDKSDGFYKINYRGQIGYTFHNSIKLIKISEFNSYEEFSIKRQTTPEDQFKFLYTDQFNKSTSTTNCGLTMFFGGIATGTIGYIIATQGDVTDEKTIKTGTSIMIVGTVISTISIPIMVIGNKKSTKILFNMNGVSAKMKF